MAFTKTIKYTTVFGNKRAIALELTSDATSGAVETGLSVIESVHIGILSANSAGFITRINKSSALTAVNGNLHFSSTTSGDHFHVLCVGR